MEIEIISEDENELLNRKEIKFSIIHNGETPDRLAVRDSLAAKMDKSNEEVIVSEMNTRFGMNETLGYAKIYEEPKYAKEIENEYLLSRNKVGVDEEDEATGEEEEPEEEETEPEEEPEAEEESEQDEQEEETDEAEADENEEEEEEVEDEEIKEEEDEPEAEDDEGEEAEA